MERNQTSLDTLCGALCCAMGIDPPACAAGANAELCAYVETALGGRKADRILMYNPDAIAQWIYEKYPDLLEHAIALTDLRLPLRTVIPPVTPVCFGTMYTGAQPQVHGIVAYAKSLIRIDTIFDALIRAGKKPCIIAHGNCSMSLIFRERPMDYLICADVPETLAKAAEVIQRDEHDFVVVYNGNYDKQMHANGPEGVPTLAALNCNDQAFAVLDTLVRTHWKHHDTLVGFAMDHGCHLRAPGRGTHGDDIPEDLNIVHLYKAHPKTEI